MAMEHNNERMGPSTQVTENWINHKDKESWSIAMVISTKVTESADKLRDMAFILTTMGENTQASERKINTMVKA